jgi:LEA14-like dessication related protein
MRSPKQNSTLASVRRIAAPALLATMLTACATMGGLSEAPRVSLVSIEPVDVQLLEQRYQVILRIQNPNDRDITIRGLDYEIVANDRIFAQGVSGKPVTIPAWGEETAAVEVVSSLERVIEQIEELTRRGEPSIEYSISGSVSVDGVPFPVPFEFRDTLGLPGYEHGEPKDGGERRRKPMTIAI